MDASFSRAIDTATLKGLSARSDLKGLVQLSGHFAALAASAWLVSRAAGGPLLALAWPLHAVVLVFLFAPLHETIHRTAFRSRWLNDAMAWMCGAVLVLPPAYFRAFHFTHHRYTQDPARDPELLTAKPESLGAYLLHVSGLPYLRAQAIGLARLALGRVEEAFIAPAQSAAVVREARILLIFYLAIAAASFGLGTWAAVTYWIVPVILGQPALRLYLLAEHTSCPLIADMFRNTRTTLTNRALRALAWNMPFHVEHHVYPGIPFHALPGAHRLLRERITVLAPGYLAVHRQILGALGPTRPAAEGDARG